MGKYKLKITVIGLLLLFTFLLMACTNKATTESTKKENEEKEETQINPEDTPLQGGVVTGAMYEDPAGMFNPIFYEDAYEKAILDLTHEALFRQNEELKFEAQLARDKWKLNKDQTKLTVKLEENITWHDGEPFTANDVVFTYQTIADPDYVKAGGIRSNYVSALLGYDDYSEGETDDFEGVVAKDDHTVIFKFSEPNVTPEYSASFPIIPKHIFKDIPVIDMPKADESRNPDAIVGTGPFTLTDIKVREQYTLKKFEDYWDGEPYLDQFNWRIIKPTQTTQLLKAGEINFVANPGGIYPENASHIEDNENINIIEQTDFYYQLLGFKHNHQTTEDVESGVINPDNWTPNDKLPQEARQAIAYAIDREALIGDGHGDGLLHGKGTQINAPIAPQSWAYNDSEETNYPYDPEKAEDILDEAGFTLDDNGNRTDPEGNEWILNMDYSVGNNLREQAAPLIKSDLEDIGIKVDLREPKEMSTFVADLTDDTDDTDLYLLGWNLNQHDPDPLGLWGIEDVYNFSRWNNPESDELLQRALETPDAFKYDFRTDIYAEWQQLFANDLPGLPLFAQNNLWAYNERLHGVTPLPQTMYYDTHLWWVDEEE